MKIQASEVRFGDYIHGVGLVESVQGFGSDKAEDFKSETKEGSPYIRMIMGEVETCYSREADRVTIYHSAGMKSYYSTDILDVTRFKREFRKVS